MGLFVGGVPVTAVHVGSTPVQEVYVGGSPPVKVWPTRGPRETVQITLGTGSQARDQLRAALTDRGLDYQTVTEIPFDIELVGTGSAYEMFWNYLSLTHAPDLDTSQVTDMRWMFQHCSSLTYVPDMDTAQVTSMYGMFQNCQSLTDGNVRLIGRHPQVDTTNMIRNSGLTREPWDIVIPRTVTINGSASGWNQATATGDTGLIQGWIGNNRVRFHAPTKCNQQVYNATSGLVVVNAGNTIPAGAPVQPIAYNGPHIFTEII